jgi:hypothetical protein
VGLLLRVGHRAAARQDQLVRLQPARPPGQRHHRHAVPPYRPGVDARVAGLRRADQLVQRDLVGAGQRQQQLQGGAALPGLQP